MNRKLVILYVDIFLETTASLKENFCFIPIHSYGMQRQIEYPTTKICPKVSNKQILKVRKFQVHSGYTYMNRGNKSAS